VRQFLKKLFYINKFAIPEQTGEGNILGRFHRHNYILRFKLSLKGFGKAAELFVLLDGRAVLCLARAASLRSDSDEIRTFLQRLLQSASCDGGHVCILLFSFSGPAGGTSGAQEEEFFQPVHSWCAEICEFLALLSW